MQMSKFLITTTFTILLSTNALANVIEFKGGEVVSHIAVDYRQVDAAKAAELQIKTLTLTQTLEAPESVLSLIVAAAAQHELDAEVVNAIMAQESNYNPKALSPKGAQGLMQLMPKTAKRYGVIDAFDPSQNIDGGILYFKDLLARYNGNLDFALAAYNAGEAAVDKYGGVPPYKETLEYLNRINRRLKRGPYAPQIEQGSDALLESRNSEDPEATPKRIPALLVYGSGERVKD